jgi:hypothetical protein
VIVKALRAGVKIRMTLHPLGVRPPSGGLRIYSPIARAGTGNSDAHARVTKISFTVARTPCFLRPIRNVQLRHKMGCP